ncbi:MAG: S8 family serine peptidase [Bacteroidaceae bacterium]|nr:S8 family serine peptidase [Bacteroidaceae bacterium]
MRKLLCAALLCLVSLSVSAIDLVRRDLGIDALHRASLLGSGVVVGVIDGGFDYTHPAFLSADRTTLRISRVWEQGTTATEDLQAPAGFSYGVELTTPEAILGAKGDISDNSHGSHVTAIIAGADTTQASRLVGLAPEAEIVLVSKADYQRGNQNILDGIRYVWEYAQSVGKPCVINMSLGNQAGPHDGTSAFDRALADFQQEGLVLVGSSGNHHKDDFHLSAVFASSDDAPLQTFVDYRTAPTAENALGDVEIWGRPGANFAVRLLCYNTKTKTATETLSVFEGLGTENGAENTAEPGAQTVAFASNLKGELLVASEVNAANGCLHVMISSRITNVRNGYALGLQVIPLSAGEVNVWADNVYLGLSSKNIEGFSAADHQLTLCEIGGTSDDIISVGAYATRTTYRLLGESQDRTLDGETEGVLCSFSSVGPTPDGRAKPEVTAPGCLTLSAVSSHDNSGTVLSGHAYDYNDLTVRYGYMQGTSMAAPVVSGVVALMLQANPTLTTATAKQLLMETARESIAKVDAQAAVQLATGVTAVTGGASSAVRYNLQGQRVGRNYRGIVIMNGKKIIN